MNEPISTRVLNVDIIVPVYNGDKYLTETLKSIEDQNLRFKKTIIINDCSSDNSNGIIQMFINRNKDFHLIEFKNNRGLAEALKAGVNYSNSDFVCILGHDDIIPNNYLEKIIDTLNTDYSIIHTDYQLIDFKGSMISTKKYFPLRIPFSYKVINGNFLYLETIDNFISTVGIFLNRNKLNKINAFETFCIIGKSGNTIFTYDEYITWVKLAKEGEVIHNTSVKTFYRTHDKNMSSNISTENKKTIDLVFRQNRKSAFEALISQENLIRVFLFIIFVYIPSITYKYLKNLFIP